MTTIAVTGAASGIGAAVCAQARAAGDQVIGIDRINAQIQADLATAAGRQAAIAQVLERSGGALDRLVCCAGVGVSAPSGGLIVAVNYFGASVLAEGLADALGRGQQPAAVIISSFSATTPGIEQAPMVEAMLADDEARALALADAEEAPHRAYAASKYAIACFVRRKAVEWGKRGIRLNALAPGAVDTPLHQAALDHPRYGEATRNFIAPLKRSCRPDEQAAVIAFLLSEQAGFIHGSVMFADGGMDAMVRPERF